MSHNVLPKGHEPWGSTSSPSMSAVRRLETP
jgi:hypothetical protein